MTSREKPLLPNFVTVVRAQDGAGHTIALTKNGIAFSMGPNNSLGQLGRSGDARSFGRIDVEMKAARAFAGGTKDSGHSALLDYEGNLWLSGCDRWQQLGLGSSNGGAAGYTWNGVWQERFQRNDFLREILKGNTVRDVALGGDHTLILSSNKTDVYSFGKGAEGQLGQISKPFVSAPAKAPALSAPNTAAVCAIRHCSVTLNETGKILKQTGKCRNISESLRACKRRAQEEGLLSKHRRDDE